MQNCQLHYIYAYLKIEQPHCCFHKRDEMQWFYKCSAFCVVCKFLCKLTTEQMEEREEGKYDQDLSSRKYL